MSDERAIELDGQLVDVMESWPLQLAVATPDGVVHHVVLSDDVVVAGAGGALGPGDLRPGMAIRVIASPVGGVGLTAHHVDVLAS